MNTVKVRFPPSPTGFCHVGTARMAIINYLFAKKHGGTIYFRSEDTDRERSRLEYEEDIKEQLAWLGLSWDVFMRQSERTPLYTAALQKLIDEGKAYISEEESKKEAGAIAKVVRLKNPGTSVTFNDLIRGDITFDTTELGDFVIARAIDDPLYQFTVVVDDADNGITHVIRGEDHISNTPRQILIQEALGYERPIYAHYPLLLGSDKSKLSKRTGDVAVKSYRESGFLPAALLNYIAVLGWTPSSGREILGLGEMIAEFDLKDLHKSGAVFDMEKLRWFNREYLLRMPESEFGAQAIQTLRQTIGELMGSREEIAWRIMPIIRERVHVWSDLREAALAGEYDFFFVPPKLDPAMLPGKAATRAAARTHLERIHEMLSAADDEIFDNAERLKGVIWEYATQEGRGAVLWPMRYALSGKEKSPDPFTIACIIGKDASLERIRAAAQLL